jgi:hypothetical protein
MKAKIDAQMEWFSAAVWVGVALLVYQNLAMADSDLPGRRQLQILSQAKDCAIYQAVLKKSLEEKAEEEARWKAVVQASQESRRQLEECAKSHGISKVHTVQEEVAAANVCFDAYENWAERGVTVELAKHNKKSYRNDYERMQALIRYQCATQTIAKNP